MARTMWSRDYALAVITAAKAMAYTAIDLLADGAQVGGNIVSNHRPDMTRPEYLKFMRSLSKEETFKGA